MTTLPVLVELAPSVSEAVAGTREAACLRIQDEVRAAAEEWGVTVAPDVRLEVVDDDLRGQLLRVWVDGRLCLVPATVLARALAYLTQTPVVPPVAEAVASITAPDAGLTTEQLHELLALVSRAAVAGRPETLVPVDDPLGQLLANQVSLAGHDHAALRGDLEGEAIPRLLDGLTAPTVDLVIDPAYLEDLTASHDGGELFAFLRDGLFDELGFVVPRMHVSLDPGLRPRGFGFRFNSVSTLPWIGLATGDCLVNDTPDRLGLMGVTGVATTNPATSQPGAIVSAAQKDELEALGLTTWDPFGYYILCLSTEIRAHVHALVSPGRVRELLASLSAAFPAVVRNLDDGQVDGVLTRLVRELLADQVSVRDLRRIVELIRHYSVAPELVGALDLSSFVRIGLADVIAEKVARGTGTLVVYLLDPELEATLAGQTGATIGAGVAEDLREALHAEMSYLPPTAQRPALLTSGASRAAARDVLRDEFPSVRVLSHDEIPPGFNVQPVARISRPEALQPAGGSSG